jgi:hypothetical protein
MEEVFAFIAQEQAWIYGLLAIAALLYIRAGLSSYLELRKAMFGLEREQAQGRIRRAGAMLGLVVTGALATFVIATYVSPAMPGSGIPSPVPTISLLTTSVPTFPPEGSPLPGVTPIPSGELDSTGCLNPNATLTSPEDGAVLSGEVDIIGTANIPNFGFYRYEYRGLTSTSAWRAIGAGDTPKVDEVLGTWDTSLVLPGDYAFRLVVADTGGNAPLPCVIRVSVVPTP